jgi:ATP-binding cassette subfamily B protein
MTSIPHAAKKAEIPVEAPNSARRFFGVFRYTKRALDLVWSTSRKLSLLFASVTVVAGILPSLVAWISARILDSVIAAGKAHAAGMPGASRCARRCSRPSSRIA